MLSIFPSGLPTLDPKLFTIDEVCKHASTTRRRVRYLVSIGAIPPPFGKKRGALYAWVHVEQIRDINRATWQRTLTAREAAEVCIYGVQKANGRTGVLATARPNSVMTVEAVYRITDHIRITAPSDASAVQRGILERILTAARLIVAERGTVLREESKALHKERAKRARASASSRSGGA